MPQKRTCLRVRLCWNAQAAFQKSGLNHDAEHPLVIPAAVTSIGGVSERASLLHCAASRLACTLSACAERPASPSPSHVCSLVDRGAPDEAYALSS